MKEIVIKNRKNESFVVFVDDEDYERVMTRVWHISIQRENMYAVRLEKVDGKYTTWSMHGFILGDVPNGMCVDHINRNGLDNRKENLRICTTAQNCRNKRKHKDGLHSRYIGVTWHSTSSMFWARIVFNRKPIGLGCYHDEKDAARAYNEAAIKYFGEYANLNEV